MIASASSYVSGFLEPDAAARWFERPDACVAGQLNPTGQAERVDGGDAWVHRKGAAPAAVDALTVVLGSRGAPSWIMRGAGAALGLVWR